MRGLPSECGPNFLRRLLICISKLRSYKVKGFPKANWVKTCLSIGSPGCLRSASNRRLSETVKVISTSPIVATPLIEL